MARTIIPITTATNEGVVFDVSTPADATNGMAFVNTGREVLLVDNAGASSTTLTVDYKADRYGRDGSDSITIAAGEQRLIGTFNADLYNQKNQVHLDFSSATSVNVAVVKA